MVNIMNEHLLANDLSSFRYEFLTRESNFSRLIFLFLPEIIAFLNIILYFSTYIFKPWRHVTINFLIMSLLLLMNFFVLSLSCYEYHFEFMLVGSFYIWLTKMFILALVLGFVFIHYYQIRFAWFDNNKVDVDLGSKYFELNLILLVLVFVSFILISQNDLIIFLVALEVFSLCLYIIASLTYEKISIEATLKYFFSNILFSLFIILGISFIYFTFFEVNLSVIQLFFRSYSFFQNSLDVAGSMNALKTLNTFYCFDLRLDLGDYLNYIYYEKIKYIFVGLFFILIGLLSKIGLFPGHFWVIDVYGNISVLGNVILSTLPKVVYLILILKFQLTFPAFFSDSYLSWILFMSGFFSIIYGTAVTLNQWRIRQFMAGSSITNLGFFIIIPSFYHFSEVHNSMFTVQIFFFYLFIYIVNTFFFFFIYATVIQPSNVRMDYFFDDLREFGHLKTNYKLISFMLAFVFLSFAGVPPLMGFFPKLRLFNYLLIQGTYLIPFILVLMLLSAISAFYYIRVIRFIFFSPMRVFTILKIRNDWIYKIFIILFFICFFGVSIFFPDLLHFDPLLHFSEILSILDQAEHVNFPEVTMIEVVKNLIDNGISKRPSVD